MIDLLRLFFAFTVGAIWITTATLIAEKSGSLGGTIGGLPSTSVVGFLFIGLNQSPSIASEATTDFPLAISITGLFLVFYAILAKNSFTPAFIGAFAIWFLLESLITLLTSNNFSLSIALGTAIFLAGYIALTKLEHIPNQETNQQLRHLAIPWRALLSGSVVTAAVLASQLGGPLLGGVASAFPAVYSSTIIITYQTGGLSFSRAITKPLLLSTAATTMPYSIAIRYLYLSLGLGPGTILAYLVALPFAYGAYRIESRHQSKLA